MNYPGGIKKIVNTKININYGNRGMDLESEINDSNNYYKEIDKAIIYKKPTPIKIAEVEYKNKSKIIKKAFFENPSTTDYNGIYNGRYIDFEAKETNNKTSFPLSNIHIHQIDHIKKILKHNGICFLIVRFKKTNETYLLLGKDLEKFLKENERSSIPKTYFDKVAFKIKDKYIPKVDYLEIIDELIKGGCL